MKKRLIAICMAAALMMTAGACGQNSSESTTAPTTAEQTTAATTEAPVDETDPTEPVEPAVVTITGSDGEAVDVMQSPKVVAVYDYAILDILQNVGFENTGIEMLVVPNKDGLPDALKYYKDLGDDKVVSGGSLFYVDWDVLDLVQPELVILGGRSFGMNAAGERLDKDAAAKFKSDTMDRYGEAAFVRLAMNSSDSQLSVDMASNVAALAAVFPELADALNAKLSEVKAAIEEIHDAAEASGKTALFCMMVDQTTMSVFNPQSRFDMLYEDFGFTPVDQEAVAWEDSHGFDVRAEYVLEKNPDVIFILDRSATVGTGAGAENFMNDPIIKQTNAAQNGNIYVLTGDAWYTMTGGFTAVESMISDLNQFISTLAE